MKPLDDDRTLTLIRIGVLIRTRADVLSDFEADLCRTVSKRYGQMGRQTAVTEAEWTVLEDALKAMQREVAA